MLQHIRSFIVVLITVLPVFAQVTISGKVTDTKGMVISGATVKMKNAGLSTTTGSDGLFSLMQKTTSILPNTQSVPQTLSANIQKGLLCIDVLKKSDVIITVLSLQGEILHRTYYQLGAGTHRLNLSTGNSGIFIYQVRSGGSISMLKAYRAGGTTRAVVMPLKRSSLSSSLLKTVKSLAFSDVLLVTKTGYTDYSMPITNPEMSNIIINLAQNRGSSSDDPLEILAKYAQADEKLNKDYQKYIKNLGELEVATKGVGKSRTIKKTIFVPPNVSYDGNGEVLKADDSALHCDLSNGEQAEDQRPLGNTPCLD